MLNTNELGGIIDAVGSTTAYTLVQEVVSGVFAVVVAVLVTLWRRSAIKSKIKSLIIESAVGGTLKALESMSGVDTEFVKQSIRTEAKNAGVGPHVEVVMDNVETKMAEEKKPTSNP